LCTHKITLKYANTQKGEAPAVATKSAKKYKIE